MMSPISWHPSQGCHIEQVYSRDGRVHCECRVHGTRAAAYAAICYTGQLEQWITQNTPTLHDMMQITERLRQLSEVVSKLDESNK